MVFVCEEQLLGLKPSDCIIALHWNGVGLVLRTQRRKKRQWQDIPALRVFPIGQHASDLLCLKKK